jgi:hypothetical protein
MTISFAGSFELTYCVREESNWKFWLPSKNAKSLMERIYARIHKYDRMLVDVLSILVVHGKIVRNLDRQL